MSLILLLSNIGGDMTYVRAMTSNNEEPTDTTVSKIPFETQQDNLLVKVELVNEWDGGYQAQIVLTNTGEEVVEDWQIDFVTSDTITSIWNCNVLQKDTSLCSISALEYNSVIHPEESSTIGYCAEGNVQDVSALKVQTSCRSAEEETDKIVEPQTYTYEYENFSIEYEIQNVWDENCNVCVRIINTSDTTIENWELAWKSEDEISNVYNAKMTCEEDLYTFKNVEYN